MVFDRDIVFISYRRRGGAADAQLLADKLTHRGFNVFLDLKSLRSGRFDEALEKQIHDAKDFVSVLTSGCFDRCAEPSDWFRLEIEAALDAKSEVNIVPVIVPGFEAPKTIPHPSVEEILNHQAIRIDRVLYDASVDRLVRLLSSSPVCELVILGAGSSGAKIIGMLVNMGATVRAVYDQNRSAEGIIEADKHKIPVYIGWPDGLERLLAECASHSRRSHCFFLVAEHERFVARVREKFAARSLENWTLLKKADDFPRDFTEDDLKSAVKKCRTKK